MKSMKKTFAALVLFGMVVQLLGMILPCQMKQAKKLT